MFKLTLRFDTPVNPDISSVSAIQDTVKYSVFSIFLF